jgi:uncharacterized coiled-coil protein SlyX
MEPSLEQRLVEIESTVAHLEKLCDELNRVVVEQAKQLTKLQAQQNATADTLTTFELERIHADRAKPPHYQ